VADVGCLAILFVLTRRENLHIRDLLGLIPRRFLVTGFGYFFLIFPFSVLGTFVASWMVYGSWQAPMPIGEVIARHLPLWGKLYSLIIWAPLWSATEELTYNGYLVPHTLSLSRRRSATLVLVGFWWALQHSFLPLVLDWHFALWRFVAFVPGVLALIVLYLRTQKLAPVIIAHWMMDLIAAATTLSF
jgi:membrane protease YdiL (CAAX protease family)